MGLPKKIREQVFKKCQGRCAYCGTELKDKWQVDHLISQRNFSTHILNKWKVPPFLSHLGLSDINHIDNLMPACPACNNWKNAFCLETFRAELQQQVRRLNKYSSNFRIAKKYGLILETEKPIVFYFETLNRE